MRIDYKILNILIVIIILTVLTGCSSKSNEFRIDCAQDSDCKSVGGCIVGCFNANNLPTQPKNEFCGQLGPMNCECVQNTCVDMTYSEYQYCTGSLCLNKDSFRVRSPEPAIFLLNITNKDSTPQTFDFAIKQVSANNLDTPINYQLKYTTKFSKIILEPAQSEIYPVIIDTLAPDGAYRLDIQILSENNEVRDTKGVLLWIGGSDVKDNINSEN